MEAAYAYLALSTALLGVWLILFAVRADIRREIIRVSVGTMFLGLTEPLFVPAYWNPPTLWNLAQRTGFDLESLLFSFAIGGFVFAAYDVIFRAAPPRSMGHERRDPRHRFHVFAILSAPLVFGLVLVLTRLNPIYAAAIGLVAGFFATLGCRPDLWRKMLVSGGLFLLVYFVVFALFNLAFPGYVVTVWNLRAISGRLLWGVPLEELMFAFTFGLYWSSIYEHLTWRASRPLPRGRSAAGPGRRPGEQPGVSEEPHHGTASGCISSKIWSSPRWWTHRTGQWPRASTTPRCWSRCCSAGPSPSSGTR